MLGLKAWIREKNDQRQRARMMNTAEAKRDHDYLGP
jgi:hypothetical protein